MAVSRSSPSKYGSAVEQYLAELFKGNNWSVEIPSKGQTRPDFVIERGGKRYMVEVKTVSESRHDRVIPMLSLAILQAQAAVKQANGEALPLAIVYVPEASPALARHVDQFARTVAKDVPVGIVSEHGVQYFSGAAFQDLNQSDRKPPRAANRSVRPAVNLFSDLNQWMLKLLLAPELPEGLLNAPRNSFQNGSELAGAAHVSAMSASRFLQQLRIDGHLDETSVHLRLVRREELFRRWGAATMRSSPEMPCRFLLRAPVPEQLRALLRRHPKDACLGLFSAADALNIGHVSGVPAYVYVRKLPRSDAPLWKELTVDTKDRPNLILRQALFPQSTFRGAVDRQGLMATDVIQTWLDVLHHPTRGGEQAALIYKRFLAPIEGRQT